MTTAVGSTPTHVGCPATASKGGCMDKIFNSKVVKVAKERWDGFITLTDKVVKHDPLALGRVFKIISYTIHGFRDYTGNKTLLSPVESRLFNNFNIFDTFCIFSDANYFIGGEYKKRNVWDNITGGLFLAADIGGLALWFDDIKFLNLANISTATGKIPVLGSVLNKIPLGTALNVFVTGAFASMAVSASLRIKEEQKVISSTKATFEEKEASKCKRTAAIIDLAWSISEIALKAFVFTGLAGVPVYGTYGVLALSAIAAGLGIATYVYDEKNKLPQEAKAA